MAKYYVEGTVTVFYRGEIDSRGIEEIIALNDADELVEDLEEKDSTGLTLTKIELVV